MSHYYATIKWNRGDQNFLDRKYSRGHEWHFDGGAVVAASSSPHIVALPMSVANNVDPEEAFVAALSSCHMLFFLDFASKNGFVVDAYLDEASGILAHNNKGQLAMTEVVLKPKVTFAGKQPSTQEIAHFHHLSHDECFIANSVHTKVTVQMPGE